MKSILFNDEMVRAILDGRKTKTRRPLKPQPDEGRKGSFSCPFGQVGDRLWVRETWYPAFSRAESDNGCVYKADYGARPDLAKEWVPCSSRKGGGWKPSIHMPRWASRITLEITDIRIERLQEITEEDAKAEAARKFTNLPPDPSPYPYGNEPRWSMEDPRSTRECMGSARYTSANLWERLYAKKGLGWYANPWVWVLTFRRVGG